MRITIPTELKEITLNQYLRFSKTLQDNPDDETFVAIQMVSIFCNLNIEQVMQIPVYDFEEIIQQLSEVLKQKPTLVRQFKLNGVKYGFVPNFDEESIGTFSYIDTLIGNEDNWTKLMSAMYRPITKSFGNMYEIEKFQGDKFAEEFANIKMDCVIGSLVFFWSLKIELLNNILDYSTKILTTTDNSEVADLFKKSGVGTIQLSKLREEIYLTLNEQNQQTSIMRLPSFCI
jgi:hypothetical protein